tara:strand:- start:302 stop:508 length:207 start_codon:yes stop_codon:yes gene_type:complete
MIEDPIVEEIRRYRKEHAAKYGNDLKKIVEAYQDLEGTSGCEYVNLEPKRISVPKASEGPEPYGDLNE